MNVVEAGAAALAVTSFWLLFGTVDGQALQPVCVQEGKFEIEDGTCTRYYLCVYDGVNYQWLILECATGTVFDPTGGTCVPSSEYACTQATTASSVTSTTSPPCHRYGRFKIDDPQCQKYYLCFWDGLSFTRIDLQCPNSLRFDPILERCVLEQNYPCS